MTPFVIAARTPGRSQVEFIITTEVDSLAARSRIDPQPGERIGAAEISPAEWRAFCETGAQPVEAMRIAVAATR